MSEIHLQNRLDNDTNGKFITSASVDDIKEGIVRGKTKIMFLLSVCWSDGRTCDILKCYKDFFDLQCSILDEFPVEGGQYNEERTIPYLPGRKIFRKSNLNLAHERKPDLDSYVKELIKLKPNISQSKQVLDFFENGLKCEEYGSDELLDKNCKENTTIKEGRGSYDAKAEGFDEIHCYVNTCCNTDIDENENV